MGLVKEIKSKANDFEFGLRIRQLQDELLESLSIISIDTDGDIVNLWYSEVLTEEQQIEQDEICDVHSPHVTGEKNYFVRIFDFRKRVEKETWYHTDKGDGTYDNKVEEIIYTYDNMVLVSKVVKTYYLDGTEKSLDTWNYYTGVNKEEIIKKG